MANEFIIKNGFRSQGDSEVTGSLSLTGGITGSFSGSVVAPGSDTQVVYNNDGVLGADSGFVYDGGGRINLGTSGGPSYVTFVRPGSVTGQVGVDSDNHAFLNASNGINFKTGNDFIPKMFISSTGNVGIGTTSPSAQLQVKGSGATSSTEALRITDTDNTVLFKILDNGQTQVTGSVDVSGSITVNNTNLQSLMIAYSIALG